MIDDRHADRNRLKRKLHLFKNLEGIKSKTTVEAMLKSRNSSQPTLEISHKRSVKKNKNKSSARIANQKFDFDFRKEVDSLLEKKLKNYNNTASTACGDSKKVNSSTLTKNKKSSRSSKIISFNQVKLMSPKGSCATTFDFQRKKSLARNLSPNYAKVDSSQQVILDILQRKNSLNCFKKLLKGKQMESTMNSMRMSKGTTASTRGQLFARKSSSKKSLMKQSLNDKDRMSAYLGADNQARSTSEAKHSQTENTLVNPKILDAMNEVYEKLNGLLYSVRAPHLSKNQSCIESMENSEKKLELCRKRWNKK